MADAPVFARFTSVASEFTEALERLREILGASVVIGLDTDAGYLPGEALCLVCNLTHNAALPECPECKDLR